MNINMTDGRENTDKLVHIIQIFVLNLMVVFIAVFRTMNDLDLFAELSFILLLISLP